MKTTPIHGASAFFNAGRTAKSKAKNVPRAAPVQPEARPLPHHETTPQPPAESGRALTSAVALLALLMKGK